MPTTWSSEQILQLAPDTSSAKAGRDLAAPRKWVTLGYTEAAVWGECQGSSKTPYQTQIDINGPAFTCTCPSRKFPCKHGLGLFLILASKPEAFTEKVEPLWVADWLSVRAKRKEKQTEKAARPPETDAAAQAKRATERQNKVNAGLQDLERWLQDISRQGLASVQGKPFSFWDNPAARLVDAQAPGLARMVREMAGVAASGSGWQEKLLERLSRLHLLLEGYKRLDTLPAPTQADLRYLIGWTQNQEELLAEKGLSDHWYILGQHTQEEDRLRTQRTWLWGRDSGQTALILNFSYGNTPLYTTLTTGTSLWAELVFYPGAYPLRAIVKERAANSTPFDTMPGYPTFDEAFAAVATALARNPWLEQIPLSLQSVYPQAVGEGWVLRDSANQLLPLSPRFRQGWELLALSGGNPLSLFGEWDGETLLPLSVWMAGRFIPVGKEG